jgi:uncharacterized protein YecE (DUF72 family)
LQRRADQVDGVTATAAQTTFGIGTSGYSYAPWKGKFYPPKLKTAEMLSYYARHFTTVEINSSFYRMPTTAMLTAWAAQVPPNFSFALKAPKRITHDRRLANVADDTRYFIEVTQTLGERAGPLLFQLPPSAARDVPRLQAFLALLPAGIKTAFEFRHPSWHDPVVHDALRMHNSAWCIADTDEAPVSEIVNTADWGYLRLRRADYDDSALNEWLTRVRAQPWRDVYVYFKHEDEARRPDLAQRLVNLVR